MLWMGEGIVPASEPNRPGIVAVDVRGFTWSCCHPLSSFFSLSQEFKKVESWKIALPTSTSTWSVCPSPYGYLVLTSTRDRNVLLPL